MSVANILKISIILCWLVYALFYSLTVAINIPTFHLDGAFQTASTLFRFNSGQFPGKDFFPYLGIGPSVILLPIFKISGSTLSASIISAQLMTLIAGILSTSLIFHLIWKPKKFSTSIAIGSIFLMLPIAVANYFSFELTPNWFEFYISPGNSLRPIRALAPYLLILFYYFIYQTRT